MKNIVLIGMPACGKSTIGYWLSKKINFPVLDADKYLEEKENRVISDIFSKIFLCGIFLILQSVQEYL